MGTEPALSHWVNAAEFVLPDKLGAAACLAGPHQITVFAAKPPRYAIPTTTAVHPCRSLSRAGALFGKRAYTPPTCLRKSLVESRQLFLELRGDDGQVSHTPYVGISAIASPRRVFSLKTNSRTDASNTTIQCSSSSSRLRSFSSASGSVMSFHPLPPTARRAVTVSRRLSLPSTSKR